ncbi:hypothetical protein PRK78_002884 [Emydomyces testavorans]|uniref:GPI anchored protein n=1 Tax=Emydomyces testavorans TaxID=2070801 RepID=A0AAF0II01_9EURO|nr:hypothetical protein PRK78_002884 [Emydomyces testavorans]
MLNRSTTLLAAWLFSSFALAVQEKRDGPSPTVSLWLPEFEGPHDELQWAASVISAKPTITSYALCPADIDLDICKESAIITVAQGSNTYELYNTIDLAGSQAKNEVHCQLSGTTRASCVGTVSASSRGVATTTVASTVFSASMSFIPVTVTAGAEKLNNVPAATTTGAGSTGATTGGAARTTTTATTASRGGVPRATGTTGWLVGGAAVAVAAIAAL